MAYEIPGFSFTLPAGADLTGALFRGVTINSSGKAALPGAGAPIAGVLGNKPNTGEAATIVHNGIVRMEAGAAITLSGGGTAVKVDAQGRAVPQSTSGVCVGWALTAASDAGEIVAVLLAPGASAPLSTTVVGDQSNIVALTNSTGVTPDNTIGAVTSVVAAAGEATAADLTTTQTAISDLTDSVADLTGKVNEILSTLDASGLTA